jgi:hypothetical protein
MFSHGSNIDFLLSTFQLFDNSMLLKLWLEWRQCRQRHFSRSNDLALVCRPRLSPPPLGMQLAHLYCDWNISTQLLSVYADMEPYGERHASIESAIRASQFVTKQTIWLTGPISERVTSLTYSSCIGLRTPRRHSWTVTTRRWSIDILHEYQKGIKDWLSGWEVVDVEDANYKTDDGRRSSRGNDSLLLRLTARVQENER